MTAKLARVRWEMGQTLLPEHFIAQEESLVTDTIIRTHFSGLPGRGVARLEWNETLISKGIFSIQAMTVVMPSGALIDAPGNAVVTPFNLNIPGTVTVPLYLHVTRAIAAAQEKEVISDFGFEEAWDEAEKDDDQGDETVSRMIYQLTLSSEAGHAGAIETLKLAVFEKAPDGEWRISGNYIPPLLQIGASPFLRKDIAELSELLEIFLYKLSQEIAASYLSGDSLTASKQCMKSVYKIQRFLENLKHQIHPHPYYVYEALKEFYTEVCFYRNIIPEHIADPYNEDRLAECFNRIIKPLKEQLHVAQAATPYLPFELKDGVQQVELPPRIRSAKEVYFLTQKTYMNQILSVGELKLTSLSRISMVHTLALQGVPLTKIDHPPFQHSFGSEVAFYLINQGEEWDYVLRELKMGFYHNARFEGVKYFIYWRML